MIRDMGAIRRDKGTGEQPRWIASQLRWRARYLDADGKRRSVYVATPGRAGQRECAARRDEALLQARQGLTAGLGAQRLDEYLARWLKVKRRDLRPRSYEKYAGTVRRHLDPFVGTVQIGRLRPQRIADLYDELLEAGRSPSNVRYVHSVLHGALEQAVAWRVIAVNPADAATAPRPRTTEIHPLTPAEARDLIAGIAGHELEVLIVLALRTAMRLGELLGLRWSDVDGAGRMLNVQRELYRLGGEWLTDAPKSGKHRSISVTDDTLAMLRAYRIDRAQALLAIGHRVTDRDLVFLTDEAEPFDGHHLTERRFKPLLRQLALPPRRFHDLRHTAATLMLAGGIHPKVVSEMLGHADVQITLNRYSHVLPTMQAEAAAALDLVTGRAAR
jgi:integrase